MAAFLKGPRNAADSGGMPSASTRRTVSVVLSVLAFAVMLAIAPDSDAQEPARSTTTISAYPKGLFGQVKSPRVSCRTGRVVVLYRMRGERPDPKADERIGQARSKRDRSRGKQSLWAVRTKADGKFYAVAQPTGGCQKDASPRTKDMPRGADVPTCPNGKIGEFCRFPKMHLDIPSGTYCPSFTVSNANCTGFVSDGAIPWCCMEIDQIAWSSDGGRRDVLVQSNFTRGASLRWQLKGYLNGPGDGALKEGWTRIYQGVAFGGSTPDLPGMGAGAMGGPLHFDFSNGYWGADIYVDGYFRKWE
ncbi:MAG: hypothetical protein U0R24_01675 [Solirubrobacterales bacterium]